MFQSEKPVRRVTKIWQIRHVASYSSLVLEFDPDFAGD